MLANFPTYPIQSVRMRWVPGGSCSFSIVAPMHFVRSSLISGGENLWSAMGLHREGIQTLSKYLSLQNTFDQEMPTLFAIAITKNSWGHKVHHT